MCIANSIHYLVLPLSVSNITEGCLTLHLPHEIIWNASVIQQGNFIDVFLAGHMARMCEERVCIGSWWGNRREGDHWGDLGVDGWIILGWISRKWDVCIWTGLGWPRIVTGGGRL